MTGLQKAINLLTPIAFEARKWTQLLSKKNALSARIIDGNPCEAS